jgi:hypothetical protein
MYSDVRLLNDWALNGATINIVSLGAGYMYLVVDVGLQ